MFLQEDPIQVVLRSAYRIHRPEFSFAVAGNMHKATPHSFRFTVRGSRAEMTVDNVVESCTTAGFAADKHAAFSLASNGSASEPGAFRYVRLTANGKTLLDIDFKNIHSVDELETYFTCYFFDRVSHDAKGFAAPIRNFWSLNERGHLVCSIPNKGRVPFAEIGPYALLTLRHNPIDDFEVEVGFEQCWRIYGIVFGCDKRNFPFYCSTNHMDIVSMRGGLAFANAHNGACYIRGDLIDPETEQSVSCVKKSCPQVEPLFRSTEETTLPVHTLTYHFDDHMTYDFGSSVIKAEKDTVLYLPPSTPCCLRGETDEIYRIEFQCDQTFAPQLFVLKQPDLVRQLFVELNSVWFSNLPNYNYRALSVFYRILSELTRPISNEYNVVVREILFFIHNHFSEPTLTIKSIAEMVHISESHLYQAFQNACGMTPKEYILNFRIQHACALLKTGQYKVYEIAEKSGFSDAKYFMTAFKRKMGTSPKQYALSI